MYHVGRPGEDGFTERVLAAGDDAPRTPDLGGASDTRSLGAAIAQAI